MLCDFLKYLISPGTLALLLGGLLATIFGFFAVRSKEETIPKYIARGSCIAGLIVFVGGIYSGFEGQQMARRHRF